MRRMIAFFLIVLILMPLPHIGPVLAQDTATDSGIPTTPALAPTDAPSEEVPQPVEEATPSAGTLVPPTEPTESVLPTDSATFAPTGTPTPQIPLESSEIAMPSASIRQPAVILPLARDYYPLNEPISFLVGNTKANDVTGVVRRANGEELAATLTKESYGDTTVFTLLPFPVANPGKYSFVVHDQTGSEMQEDFWWGTVLVNVVKKTENPDHPGSIALTVLDQNGAVQCNTTVAVTMTDPTGQEHTFSTQDGQIAENPECVNHDYTVAPDYSFEYTMMSSGRYGMTVHVDGEDGSYDVRDAFDISDTESFAIDRNISYRMLPPRPYPMTIRVTARDAFNGKIVEAVPADFAISKLPDALPYDSVRVAGSGSSLIGGITTISMGMPFAGDYPVTLGFGEEVTDPAQVGLYTRFGLAGHDGVDFGMPEGTPILAVDDGQVVLAGDGTYGTTVVLTHAWGKSYYGHLSEVSVQLNQKVSKADVIGHSGSTGIATGPHLHFGLKLNNNDIENGFYGKIDPIPYLNRTSIITDSSVKLISWSVVLTEGESVTLGYTMRAPVVSPAAYRFGPLQFVENAESDSPTLIYVETRTRSLAVDGTRYTTTNPAGSNLSVPIEKQGFTLTNHAPKNYPEEFYINLDRLAETELANDGIGITEQAKTNQKQTIRSRLQHAILRRQKVPQSQEIGEYIPHDLQQTSDGGYTVTLRTVDGMERYVFSPHSPVVRLEESTPQDPRFRLRATSEPLYEYRASESARPTWDRYLPTGENRMEATESATGVTLTQTTRLAPQDGGDEVDAVSEWQFGIDIGNEVGVKNKVTFQLNDNPRINRMLWDVTIAPGFGSDVTADNDDVRDPEHNLPVSSDKRGNLEILWSDFAGATRLAHSYRDQAAWIYFSEQGTQGGLVIDPTFTLSVGSTEIQVDDGTRMWCIGTGGVGTSVEFWQPSRFKHDNVGGNPTSCASGGDNLISQADDLWDNLVGYSGNTNWGSGNTMELLESSPTRSVIQIYRTDGTHRMSLYPNGYGVSHANLTTGPGGDCNFSQHWLNANSQVLSVDDTNRTWVISDTTNNNNAGVAILPYTTGSLTSCNANPLQSQSDDFNGWWETISLATGNHYWLVDFSNYRATTTTRDNKRNDYRNPDDLSDGLQGATGWFLSDENTSSSTDYFNEAEDTYDLNANVSASLTVTVDLDGGTYTRYDPIFKIRGWRSLSDPASVRLEGAAQTNGTNFNADVAPFSEAYVYDADGSGYRKLAEGGDDADADEYLNDATNDWNFGDSTYNFGDNRHATTACGASSDCLYFGHHDQFTGVNINLGTVGAGSGATIQWQYCSANSDVTTTCDTWSNLTVSEDFNGVSSLRSNGVFYFSAPGGWVRSTENSGRRSLWWIRGYANGSADYTTKPIEDQMKTDILLFQYLGSISSDNQTFEITQPGPDTDRQLRLGKWFSGGEEQYFIL